MIPTTVVATDGNMLLVIDGKEFHVLIEGRAFSFVATEVHMVRINPNLECYRCKQSCQHTRMVARWLLQLFPAEVPDAEA